MVDVREKTKYIAKLYGFQLMRFTTMAEAGKPFPCTAVNKCFEGNIRANEAVFKRTKVHNNLHQT